MQETAQWLVNKIAAFAGGVQFDKDFGTQEITWGTTHITKHIERNNVNASVGPEVCMVHVSWHKSYLWTRNETRRNSSAEESDSVQSEVSMDLPLFDLKTADVAYDSSYEAKALRMTFNGKKAVIHSRWVETGSQNIQKDADCSGTSLSRYIREECSAETKLNSDVEGRHSGGSDHAEAEESIPFQRDKTQDNDELAGRVAAALNHLRDLCAAIKPKSAEPF